MRYHPIIKDKKTILYLSYQVDRSIIFYNTECVNQTLKVSRMMLKIYEYEYIGSPFTARILCKK